MADAASNDPRVHFAAERTFLAWIRTGLALMGFGFVVARFGLFLKEVAVGGNTPGVKSYGFSLWAGSAMVMLGGGAEPCGRRSAPGGDQETQSGRERDDGAVPHRDHCRNLARIGRHRDGHFPGGGELSGFIRAIATRQSASRTFENF